MLTFSHAHFPVTSLGYGRRVGIWVQGCSIRCPGCVAKATWMAGPEHAVDTAALVAKLAPWIAQADGVTISGGEPFDQPVELLRLIRAIRPLCTGDVMVYSGRPESVLRESFSEILAEVDVVVAEPFILSLPDTRPFIGSSNQKLLLLTNLGRDRYSDLSGMSRAMNVAVVGDRVLMAGVPERGHMDLLRAVGRLGGPANLAP